MKNAVFNRGSLKKSTVNPTQPNIKDASGGGKGVHPAPKINAEAGGKRVILTEASASGKKNTFTAPRKDGSMDPAMCGYTKPGKM